MLISLFPQNPREKPVADFSYIFSNKDMIKLYFGIKVKLKNLGENFYGDLEAFFPH